MGVGKHRTRVPEDGAVRAWADPVSNLLTAPSVRARRSTLSVAPGQQHPISMLTATANTTLPGRAQPFESLEAC